MNNNIADDQRLVTNPVGVVAPSLHATIGIDYPTLAIDVEITVQRGEILGLVGQNGAGKTTLLRAIAGLQPIDRGQIVIGPNTVDDPASNILIPPQRRHVGVVFQDYRLFPNLSTLDNIAFGLQTRSTKKAEARRVAKEWLERFDLTRYANAKPDALSGGQAQRVALARALATRPEVLLLDEPLAAIDPDARAQIRDDLGRYLASFNGVTVIVSHQHNDIRTLANHALVITNGTITWHGPADQLPRSG